MMRKTGFGRLLTALICTFVLMIGSAVASAAEAQSGMDWDTATVTAEGYGVAPATAYSAAQARMMARRAAIVDAYRQLAEQIKGVNVDATTTVGNMMVTDDTVTTKVSAFVQGARIISEKAGNDGSYTVTMRVPVYGVTNSLVTAVMPRPEAREAFPAPTAGVAPSIPSATLPEVTQQPETSTTPIYGHASSASEAPAGRAIGGYTGLIVDCRGLGLKPVMSPVIKNEAGSPIYGYKNLDYDLIVKNGMAGYARDISQAKRAGTSPLVVRAIGIDGGNPILSTADANRVLIENGATGFLDTASVVFVR